MEYKNYKKHAAGILKSPVRLQQQKDAMNKSRQSKAADMSTCNHDNQNNNIYNEWNTTNNMAVDININNDKKKNHSSDNEWNTKKLRK